jgi:hypothetical protein
MLKGLLQHQWDRKQALRSDRKHHLAHSRAGRQLTFMVGPYRSGRAGYTMPLYCDRASHLMLKMSGSLNRSSSTRPFRVVLKVGVCNGR